MKILNFTELNQYLPEFDQVEKFDIDYNYIEASYTLTLIFSKDLFSQDTKKLLIEFSNISDLSLKNSFLNNFQQFMSLVIEKDNNQWENVNYRISQVEDENIAFKCKNILSYLI